MKFMFCFVILAIFALTSAARMRLQKPRDWPPRGTGLTRPGNPFGGHRFRREANPQGALTGSYRLPLEGNDRRPSYNLGYKYSFVDHDRASVDARLLAQKLPGMKLEPTIGLHGEWRYRRDLNDQMLEDDNNEASEMYLTEE